MRSLCGAGRQGGCSSLCSDCVRPSGQGPCQTKPRLAPYGTVFLTNLRSLRCCSSRPSVRHFSISAWAVTAPAVVPAQPSAAERPSVLWCPPRRCRHGSRAAAGFARGVQGSAHLGPSRPLEEGTQRLSACALRLVPGSNPTRWRAGALGGVELHRTEARVRLRGPYCARLGYTPRTALT